MPSVYEYKCPICDRKCTTDSKLKEELVPWCGGGDPRPEHKLAHMKRVYSLGAVILKGSGWAKNDK